MAYPDLYKDESRLLETQNVKVKSVTFDAVLTTRRLILLDSKKKMVPPQEILLATVKHVEGGENAIRDPTITLSIITNTGTTRQMIMTFSNKIGGERKRECDEWVRGLRHQISQTIEHPILPDIATPDVDMPAAVPAAPAAQAPRIELVNTPPQKKRIEISRPMKKIIESEPAMPMPVETTTLPVGSFCNRCGSRVPPESVFCNRCGTPVVKDGDLDSALASPAPKAPPQPAPVVPQVSIPVPASTIQPAQKRERPIDETIHSIEPLIEDSVPRKMDDAVLKKPKAPEPAAEVPAAPEKEPEVNWPVITPSTEVPPTPKAEGELPKELPESPLRPVPEPSSGRGKGIIIAALAVVVIIVIAAIFVFANPLQMVNDNPPATVPAVTTAATMLPVTTAVPAATTAVPAVTAISTTVPAPLVPATGVWIRINYANEFSGTVGTPGAEREISDTGEKLYQISTSTGTVVASILKVDGSADLMTVELFKDGELVIRKTTSAPKGLVEIQTSLKPAATPTPAPTTLVTTVAPEETTAMESNSTANQTASG
ncbi:MAG TPA: hypothetical protein HA272_06650 [Methanoregula sp.]|nr:hypothetical protein [Methanoregula sp.]